MSDKSRSAENIRSIFEPHVRGGSLLLFRALQLVCLQIRAEISWHLDPRSLLADSRFSQEHYRKQFHLKFVCSLVELQAGLTAHGCLSLQLLIEFLQNKLWAHRQANAALFLPLASPGPMSDPQPPAHIGTHFHFNALLYMLCFTPSKLCEDQQFPTMPICRLIIHFLGLNK